MERPWLHEKFCLLCRTPLGHGNYRAKKLHCTRCFHAFCQYCCDPRSYSRVKTAVCLACSTHKDISRIFTVSSDDASEQDTLLELIKTLKPQESTKALQQQLINHYSQVSELRLLLNWYITKLTLSEAELQELTQQQLALASISQALATRKAALVAQITEIDEAALPSEITINTSSDDSSDDLCGLL